MDMTMILGGVILPNPRTFERTISPNETDIRTLGGTLYTDFINNNREWRIAWENITQADYQTIYNVYLAQYTNRTYPILQFDAYGILGPVKLNIEPQGIKYNGVLISFTATIKEKNAFS